MTAENWPQKHHYSTTIVTVKRNVLVTFETFVFRSHGSTYYAHVQGKHSENAVETIQAGLKHNRDDVHAHVEQLDSMQLFINY